MSPWRYLLAAAALAACATASETPEQAASAPREPPVSQRILTNLLEPPEDEADLGGARAQAYAMVGREDLAWVIPRVSERPVCTPLLRDGEPVDPAEEIVARAAEAQFVMLNEAHHDPHHRAFIAEVAERLRTRGFSIYAAETFSTMAVDRTETWPHTNDGYYTDEPLFGALLRRVRALGYELVAYERIRRESDPTGAEGVPLREQGQAENLRARILDRDPNARVLVHAGHGHVSEHRGHETFGPLMAQRFKQMTGIDPLTVDQTRFAAPGAEFVVCDLSGSDQAAVDLRIGSPNPTFERSRPTWRRRGGQQDVELPRQLTPIAEPTIFEARYANEPDEAVPVDRILVRPGEDIPLLLPAGRYRVEAWTPSAGWSRSVRVNAP